MGGFPRNSRKYGQGYLRKTPMESAPTGPGPTCGQLTLTLQPTNQPYHNECKISQAQNAKFGASSVICFWVMLKTNTFRNTHAQKERKRPIANNVILGFRRPPNVKIHQNLNFKNLTQKQYFFYLWIKESNTLMNIHYPNFIGIGSEFHIL